MIDKDKIKELVKSSLPQANSEVVEHITDDVIRDAEAAIHSMVRQAAAQERERSYQKRNKSEEV